MITIFFLTTFTAQAALCRTIDNHKICILTIKRSAKYYWKYRAKISIDGEEKPIEVYNCRTRSIIQADRKIIPFQTTGAGELICNTFIKKY